MDITLKVSPTTTMGQLAHVELTSSGGDVLCNLRFDSRALSALGTLRSRVAWDLLLIAATVYALDRRVPRGSAADAWTRRFSVSVPVSEPELWDGARATLEAALSFLSGDYWRFKFLKTDISIIDHRSGSGLSGSCVSLFSGGLDSLIGVIDYLERNTDGKLVLVGHHDPRMGGPLSDQRQVLKILQDSYPGRLSPVLASVGADKGSDTTLRSRSFLFIALGVMASQALPTDTTLMMPENGTIALNAPLTVSRQGSCSTRTAHPHYLGLVNKLLGNLGLGVRIDNPLALKTKGESVVECLNQDVLASAIHLTASCAKRGHRSHWVRRTARQCGRCMPCIYRRAALNLVGLDSEVYGNDICSGEVDPFSTRAGADDLRALLSFLRSHHSIAELKELLFTSGTLEIANLDAYAGIVSRAAEEVRQLLTQKGTTVIKAEAGV